MRFLRDLDQRLCNRVRVDFSRCDSCRDWSTNSLDWNWNLLRPTMANEAHNLVGSFKTGEDTCALFEISSITINADNRLLNLFELLADLQKYHRLLPTIRNVAIDSIVLCSLVRTNLLVSRYFLWPAEKRGFILNCHLAMNGV